MKYIPEYTPDALEDLSSLDPKVARRIVDKINYFAISPNPLRHAKHLEGKLAGSYRFRIGVYRALFYLDGKHELVILKVYKVGHRKDIYE